MTVGDRIKMRREELGLSQDELAHKLGLRGRSSVSRAEKSGDKMTPTLMKAYANALNCSYLFLMGIEDEEDTPYNSTNSLLVAKVLNDEDLTDALKVYFSLPDDKKKYAVNLIKMLGD